MPLKKSLKDILKELARRNLFGRLWFNSNRILKYTMNHEESEKLDLIHGLCNLFTEIDINNDKKMEWEEFTQYIVDAVVNNIKEYNNGELPNQNEMIELAHAKKLIKFSHSIFSDSVIHENIITKAMFSSNLNNYFSLFYILFNVLLFNFP